MPICKNNGRSWESTLLLDIFNNEIIVHQATPFQGRTKPYYHCLEQLKPLASKKNEEQTPPYRPGVLSTPHKPSNRLKNIITYFVQCREQKLRQIMQ